jgi:hypothetical protein
MGMGWGSCVRGAQALELCPYGCHLWSKMGAGRRELRASQ